MKLSADQIELFEAGCRNRENDAAQELLNVFGVAQAREVLDRLPSVPVEILSDLASHFWQAMDHEAKRRVLLDSKKRVAAAVVGHQDKRHH